MSQLSPHNSLLQEVRGWPDEKCKNEFNTAVPQLLEQFNKTTPVHLMELSSTLIEKFLCFAVHDDLGRKIMDTVSLELAQAFDEVLSQLPGKDVDSSKMAALTILPVLETSVNIVQCFDKLVEQLASIIKKSLTMIELAEVSQISNNTISVLKKSYDHCKSSEKDYGKVFKHASKTLGLLFQKTYGLQKSLGFMIGNIKQAPDIIISNETKASVESICEGLLSICQTTCTVDNTLLAATWKMMLGFMREFQDIVKSEIKPTAYMALLIENVLQSVKYLFQLYDNSSHLVSCGDEPTKKALAQSSKFTKYFITYFSEMVKIFQDDIDVETANCILQFLSDFYLCFEIFELPHVPNDADMKFRMDLLSFVQYEGIVSGLLNTETFLGNVAAFALKNQTCGYGWLHVWLSLSKILLKNHNLFISWCEKSGDGDVHVVILISCIIDCMASMTDSINLVKSPAQGGNSLYDAALTYVCALVSQLPQTIFVEAEEKLFHCAISDDPTKSIFACDIITFLAKSSKSLLEHYVSVLCAIFKSAADGEQLSFPLQSLIFLSYRIGISVTEIIENLSDTGNALPSWSTSLSRGAFDETNGISLGVCKEISAKSENETFTVNGVHQLTGQLQHVRIILEIPNMVKRQQVILKTCCISIVNTLMNFMKSSTAFSKSLVFSNFVSTILATMKVFSVFADASTKSEIIQCLLLLMQNEISIMHKLTISEVLANFQGHSSNTIQDLSISFQNLIGDSNWRVSLTALKSFSKISQSASGTSLVEKCAANPNVAVIMEKHFSFECNSTNHTEDTKVPPASIPQIQNCYKSWSNELLKQSKIFSDNVKSLPNPNVHDVAKCISDLRESVTALNQSCQQHKLKKKDLDTSTLQNLSEVKSTFDGLLRQFDL